MMRLILAHKPMKGIEEKLLKSQDQKSGKNIVKNTKMKNITTQYRRLFNPKARLY
jgi:hypothetical protein